MSGPKILSERERAFEEVFFRKESERLVEAMRERKSRQENFDALSAALGVDSPAVIDSLLDLGVREENVTALMLAPMVAVAWADHTIHPNERRSILKAEHDLGIAPDSQAGELLAMWLEFRPHESLLDTWSAYVGELCENLGPDERTRLRDDTVARAGGVARAFEKTFLRAHGPTDEEKAVLQRIEAAFP